MSAYGVDPRDNALLAFGGAGPMTACFLAEELGVRHVLVPATPGVLSALGGLIADLKNDFIKTVYLDLDDDDAAASIRKEFAALRTLGAHWLHEEQGYEGEPRFLCSADMRYRGQSFEVETDLADEAIEKGDLEGFADAFHEAHQRLYFHSDREASVQVINLRLVAVGHTPKPGFTREREDGAMAEPERRIPIHAGGHRSEVPLFLRERLRPGNRIEGPAVVAQEDATVCVSADFAGHVDGYGNLLLHRARD